MVSSTESCGKSFGKGSLHFSVFRSVNHVIQ